MRWLHKFLVALTLFAFQPTFADSWAPAERASYLSPDRATRLTVVPRSLESPLAFFSDKVEGKEPAGQRTGGQKRALGILERRSGESWVKVWEAPLVNDVAPVRAVVANGGKYVVTFDNWHSVGFGDNVVVIYRSDGSLVRALKLIDVLPEDYIRALPRSVSSIWWGGEHKLSANNQQVVLKVVVPSKSGSLGASPLGFVDVSIDLATGAVAPFAGPAWDRAMSAAAPIAARSKAAEARWRARQIAPLKAPTGSGQDDWRRYLNQAVARLTPASATTGFDPVWVLPLPGTPEFAESAENIRGVFTDWDEKSDLAFASPSAPADLARILIQSAQMSPANRLIGSRLFIALPKPAAEGVDVALKRTGATIVVFDPAISIPQRAEELRKLGVAPADVDAEAARAAADASRLEAEAVKLDGLAPKEPTRTSRDVEALEEMADRLEAEADKLEAQAKPKPN